MFSGETSIWITGLRPPSWKTVAATQFFKGPKRIKGRGKSNFLLFPPPTLLERDAGLGSCWGWPSIDYVAQSSFELMTLPSQPPMSWDCGCAPSHPLHDSLDELASPISLSPALRMRFAMPVSLPLRPLDWVTTFLGSILQETYPRFLSLQSHGPTPHSKGP